MLIKNSGTVEEITTAAEDIPVFICNFNRLTTTRATVDWFRSAGSKRIVIVDNESTYPPLLEWYATAPAEIVRLPNQGCWKTWEWINSASDLPFMFLESDVVPSPECPKDLVAALIRIFNENPSGGIPSCSKIGPCLRVQNAPDVIRKREAWLWQFPITKDAEPGNCTDPSVPCHKACIDTAAMLCYPHQKFTNGWDNIRLDEPYSVEHIPWYETHPLRNEEEEQFYRENAKWLGSYNYWKEGDQFRNGPHGMPPRI